MLCPIRLVFLQPVQEIKTWNEQFVLKCCVPILTPACYQHQLVGLHVENTVMCHRSWPVIHSLFGLLSQGTWEFNFGDQRQTGSVRDVSELSQCCSCVQPVPAIWSYIQETQDQKLHKIKRAFQNKILDFKSLFFLTSRLPVKNKTCLRWLVPVTQYILYVICYNHRGRPKVCDL